MSKYAKCLICGTQFVGTDSPRTVQENAHAQLLYHYEDKHAGEGFTCGRRNTDLYSVIAKREGCDFWTQAKACSYCGSMSQEDFFSHVEAGKEIGPTDKTYKAYVGNGKFYFQHLDKEGRKKFVELYNSHTMRLGVPGYFYVRPYFITFPKA